MIESTRSSEPQEVTESSRSSEPGQGIGIIRREQAKCENRIMLAEQAKSSDRIMLEVPQINSASKKKKNQNLKLECMIMSNDSENLTFNRKCGSCTACCTHLGITELKKFAGTTCQHLDTKHFGSQTCCKIYDSRPKACKTYHCCWIVGLGPDLVGRPDRSGLLISMYKEGPPDSPYIGITITMIDPRRAGGIEDPNSLLNRFIQELLGSGIPEIRIINRQTAGIIHIRNNEIRLGKIHPQRDYEDLIFEIQDRLIGIVQKEPT